MFTVREDATSHTVSKAHRLHSAEPLSAGVCKAFRAARLDPRRPFAPESFPRGPGRVEGETKGSAEQLLIAWLKTRLCAAGLMLDGKFSAVYSWHDLRHAFAQRNAGRGLVWLRDRFRHSSVSVTERYLRNVLHVDTGKM